jgi:DNA-binding transcriptional LysR family regulator
MKNIDFELYRVFCCVAENGNLTKASNELFISQPAVTQSIKKLESELGCSLLYRTKKGVDLTLDGKKLYNLLKYPIECLNDVGDRITNEEKRIIRIGSGTTLIKNSLIRPLKIFKNIFPDIIFEIKHDLAGELLKLIDNDLLDIAIAYAPIQKSDNYIIETIEVVEPIFAGSSIQFPQFKDKVFELEELNNLPLILQSEISSSRKFLDNICRKKHIKLNSIYELASYGLVLDFVKEGLGIGLINKNHIENELSDGSLFSIRTSFDIPKREVCIAVNKKVIDNEYIKKFLNILRKV